MKKIAILSWLFFFLFLFPLFSQTSANYKGADNREIKFQNLRELSLNDLKIVDSGGSTRIMLNGKKIYESGWQIHSAPGEPIEIQKPRILYANHNGKKIIAISESGAKLYSKMLVITNGSVRTHLANFYKIKKAICYNNKINLIINNSLANNLKPDQEICLNLLN